MNNQAFKYVAAILSVVIVTLLANHVLLGGASVVKLEAAPPLYGVISQSIGLSGSDTTLPKPGKDYTLKNVRYFSSGQWAAAVVAPAHENSDTTVVILKKVNGVYEVVLKPSTSFSVSYRYTLPADVIIYLDQLGVING